MTPLTGRSIRRRSRWRLHLAAMMSCAIYSGARVIFQVSHAWSTADAKWPRSPSCCAQSEYVLTGANASEDKLKEASAAHKMAKARYVHFATHGILGVDKGK